MLAESASLINTPPLPIGCDEFACAFSNDRVEWSMVNMNYCRYCYYHFLIEYILWTHGVNGVFASEEHKCNFLNMITRYLNIVTNYLYIICRYQYLISK